MKALVVVATMTIFTPVHAEPRDLPGWPLYERACLPCHGSVGDGHGPAAAFTWGKPRSFVTAEYAWRSTPIGQPPTDDDLHATIEHGAPGTSMPGFGGALGPREIDQLVAVVKAFAAGTPFARAGKPIALGAPPPIATARGAKLWTERGCDRCHGATGRGDGPAAKALEPPPYDLTSEPLHRPHGGNDLRRAAATSIATGLSGTPMPGYAGQVADDDIWALADQVVALGARARADRGTLSAAAITSDRDAPIETGTWPGRDDGSDAMLFGRPLAPNGLAPQSLAPAEASLDARQCARCHAKQFREWQGSIHAAAASPGFVVQVAHAEQGTCARCHTPLAEQSDDMDLRGEGVQCAGCHVRSWIRHGPPRVSPSLIPTPSYPLVTQTLYERADFCMPCHQLPPRTAVEGKPLLDTYREWLESAYMRNGIQCQHCHMPNREHQWLGIHDRETVRQGLRLGARAWRTGDVVTVVAELSNVGAGHRLPTTTTPAVFVRVELVDAAGRAIPGARDELRIGRDVYNDGRWHERSDTRIAPGETRRFARAWTAGATPSATRARVTVEVHPDAYYEGVYAQRLAAGQGPRAELEAAQARARASHYVAEQRDVEIAVSSKQ